MHFVMTKLSSTEQIKRIGANYRVKESIVNFKLRVKVVQQRSLLADLLETEGDTRDTNFIEEEDYTFGWQQKVFGRFEINIYSDENNCITECQKKYHKLIKDNALQGSRLYSYTQDDFYYPDKRLLSTDYKSYLSVQNRFALPAMQNRKPFSERYNKMVIDTKVTNARIRSNHYYYSEPSKMYVLIDLDRKDEPSMDSNSEILLCSIAYDKVHRILRIEPDFTSDEYYTIISNTGIKYDYWIEHVSEKQSLLEMQQQRQILKCEIQQRIAYKDVEMPKEIELIMPNIVRIFLNLDITSAHNFFYNDLFITYYIDLPKCWSTNQTEKLFGRTQRCRLQNKSAYFSYAMDISLDFDKSMINELTILPNWPSLLLHVASIDSWTRYRTEGYAALSLPTTAGAYKFTVPTWRITGNIIDSLRRLFTGDAHELEDITYCRIPTIHEGVTLDKLNLNVVSSGYVNINVNIVFQNHIFTKNSKCKFSYFKKQSADVLMNNVESVLEQFKVARERMLRIRNTNI